MQLCLDTKTIELRMYKLIDNIINPSPRTLNRANFENLQSLVARLLTILSGRPWPSASPAELYREAASVTSLTEAATPLASFFELLPPDKLVQPELAKHSGDQLNMLSDLLRDFCGLLLDSMNAAQAKAQQSLGLELRQSGHAPHVALYIAFVMMYQKVQHRLNQFPQDLLDFYHQTVLRQAEFSGRRPRPDRVVLTFRPQPDVPTAAVPISAEFIAGNDAAGNPIIYTPDFPIDASNINLVRLRNLRLFPLSTATSRQARPLLSQVLTTEISLPLAQTPAANSQPLFPPQQPSPASQLQSLPAELGFGCASPLLELRGGDRSVSLGLELWLPSPIPAAATTQEQQPALLANLLQDHLSAAISDGAELRDVRFTVSVPVQPPDLGAGLIRINLVLNLEASIPAWTSNPNLHSWPLLLFRLKPEAMVSSHPGSADDAATAYTWLSQLHLHGLSLDVRVQNHTGLALETPFGLADPSAPFQLFGAPACRGASFMLYTDEMAGKPIDSLSIDIYWHNLPVNAHGFADYYQAYVIDADGQRHLPGSLFPNSCFQVDVQLMTSAHSRLQPSNQTSRLALFPSAHALESCSHLSLNDLQGMGKVSCLRVTLSEPAYGFGDSLYQANIMEASIALSNLYRDGANPGGSASLNDPAGTTTDLRWPNQPWQPQASSVALSYQSSAQLSREGSSSDTSWIAFLHLKPFSAPQPVAWPEVGPTTLLPSPLEPTLEPGDQAKHASVTAEPSPPSQPQEDGPTRRDADACLILEWSQPFRQLDLLIGLSTATTMQPQPRPLWIDIWQDAAWHPLPQTAYQDGSSGLTTSGILRMQLPVELSSHCLRLSISLAKQPIPELVCLEPNAVWVSWQGPAGEDRLDHCLPAGTISTCRSALSGITKISQPLPSLGGMPADGKGLQQVRFTERLAHKGVAIQPDDYAKILLDQFPTLWQVAVLPATDAEGQPSPGSVALVPIPGPKAPTVADPTAPVCDGAFRLNIAQVLSSRISPFAKLAIVDPLYCRITVKAQVIVTRSVSVATALQQLQHDLVLFLSPWPLEDPSCPRPSAYYEELNIGHFIRERPYIQAIESLQLDYSPNLQDCEQAAFLYFTSAAQHQLGACLPRLATV
ncbi:MAG: hypothetical protein ACK5N0_01280 [Synechococcaceae cyanobacterium]